MQARKAADDYLKAFTLDGLETVSALKEAVAQSSVIIRACNVQFIEAGLVFALRHLSGGVKKDKKTKKDKEDKKETSSMKQIITDMNTKLVSGEYGVKPALVHEVLMSEATKFL